MTTHLRIFDNDQPSRMLEVGVDGWGYARLAYKDIQGLRKSIPSWAPPDTPNHFFKYSDEQTILAVRAVDSAMQRHGLDAGQHSRWAVVAAPHFLGRVQGANIFRRFLAGGASAVSPHTIPQHSLHSVSGALSVLLATHGPNLGVGGGPHALADALLTATSLFEADEAPGAWLVCTQWDPEPLPDRDGNCTNEPICHAFALALKPAAAAATSGRLMLYTSERSPVAVPDASDASVAQIVDQLALLDQVPTPRAFEWRMPWGATAILLVHPVAAQLPLAA